MSASNREKPEKVPPKSEVKLGRPRLIETPEELYAYFLDYKKLEKSNPTLVEDYVGKDANRVLREKENPLSLDAFENYVAEQGGPWSLDYIFANQGGAYTEFLSCCARVRREIRADQIKGGMVGIYNNSITQRLNGLSETVNSNVTASVKTDIDYSQLSDEAIEEILNASRSNQNKGGEGA